MILPRYTSLLVTGLLLTMSGSAQHTPLTSQYLFNGLVINPAYAGSRDALAMNLTHRQQWVGFDGAPVTQTISIHAPLDRRKLGLGLVLYTDKIGVSRQTGLFTNYAYRIKFRRGKLAMGLGAGFTMLRAAWNEVATQQQNDISFASPTQSAFRPNFSAGAFYYTKRSFIGLSAPFLLAHRYDATAEGYRISDVKADLGPMITAGHVLDISPDVKLKPSTLLRYRSETGLQADVTSNVIFKDRLWAGVSYRTGDALIGSIEVLPTPQWRFGYAYDLGMSSLRPYHAGSHELMVQYEFGYRIRVRDPRYF
ncbi:MAG: type IX secretion system membrane protein PorP/SprF [Flavobacteriales bacterium]